MFHTNQRPSFCAILLFAILQLPCVSVSADVSLHRIGNLLPTSRAQRYIAPTPAELQRCEELFLLSLTQLPTDSLKSQWEQLGFQFSPLDDAETTWVIQEAPSVKRGWGLYIISPATEAGIVLQAPHRFADKHTGRLLLHLYLDGRFKGAAWNTINRKKVDVAHDANHPFTAFTRAVTRADERHFVTQLHGFSSAKRKTSRAALADLIVSNGTRHPERWVRRNVVEMQAALPFAHVELFPMSVNELGATTNVQGEAMRRLGSSRFLHFEMSQSMRLRLISDARIRSLFLKKLSTIAD